jgi:hypothetical protein
MHKMPKEIEFVADKILKDKALYDEIKGILKALVTKLNNDSLSHSSFCDTLKTPGDGMTKKFLQIFGLNDRQMLDAFEQIGFHPDSRMYSNLYYQTLSLIYYIGVRANDDLLRHMAVTLIYVKLFNGRKYKWMPNGCQEEIGQYLLTNVFRESHTFKKYPNPFIAITTYFVPTLDNKYKEYVERDPAHPTEGIIAILKNGWVRMDQVFRGVKDHYYQAVQDGNRSAINSSSDSVGGKEVDQLEMSKVEKLVTKVQKVLVTNSHKLTPEDVKYLKETPYLVSDAFVSHVQLFLTNSENEDDIKNIYELMFSIIKVQDESSLCATPVVSTVTQLSSSKGSNAQVTKLKTYIDSLLSQMYKGIMKSGSQSQVLKLRKVIMLIMLLQGKKSFCPKAHFEKSNF